MGFVLREYTGRLPEDQEDLSSQALMSLSLTLTLLQNAIPLAGLRVLAYIQRIECHKSVSHRTYKIMYSICRTFDTHTFTGLQSDYIRCET